MKVTCVNDSNRPSDFPLSKWIVKGEEYTVIDIFYAMPQDIECVKLEEINLSGLAYDGFAAYRFELSSGIEKQNEYVIPYKVKDMQPKPHILELVELRTNL